MTGDTDDRQHWPAQPSVWVGANFWSRAGGPRMWARYDGDVVREELATLAQHGCTLTRSFCFWADFMPAPETLDEEVMERFGDFLELHSEAGMWTIPTFIVGHMSGQNWDPSWRQGRDLYEDIWLVGQQAWLVSNLASRFAAHPAVAGWLLSNEMPIYGGEGRTESVTAWARILVQALRSAGATQPVGTGDGAWGPEMTGSDNGFSCRRLAPIVDFIGPHVYLASDDPVRQMTAAAFTCELAGAFGKPVVLEEFGLSSDMASDDNAAHYYRQVLHSSLVAGARGWLAWNNCDYDNLANEEPYRHHPFEMHFGLTDHSGRPKAQAREVARFSALVQELSAQGWERQAGDVAIVVPEHLERYEPSWSKFSRDAVRPNLLQSYVAARHADLPVALVRETDLPGPGHAQPDQPSLDQPSLDQRAKLYLLPCAKLVTTDGSQALLRLASSGATVYASYFAGHGKEQVGPWMPWMDQIFGTAHQLRYGLADRIEEDEVRLHLLHDVGELPKGTELVFPVEAQGFARSFLPVSPVTAEVLAVDASGRPALLRNATGDGWTVLCTYPLEHLAACRPAANPEDTWKLYSALATASGVARPLRANDPRVTVGQLRVGDAMAFVASNTSPSAVQVTLSSSGFSVYRSAQPPGQAGGPGEGDAVTELLLGPYEVALLYSRPGRSAKRA